MKRKINEQMRVMKTALKEQDRLLQFWNLLHSTSRLQDLESGIAHRCAFCSGTAIVGVGHIDGRDCEQF